MLVAVLLLTAAPAADMTKPEMISMLEKIDDRQSNSGDWKSLAYIEQKEKDKDDLLYESVIYRRDVEDKLLIMFTKPKQEAGKGYLSVNKNLFLYDPTVGKWERRTERERIGGTAANRSDFDESRLAKEFEPTYKGLEKLGKFAVHHLELKAKSDADVAYPMLNMWIDTETLNILKRQDHALSGRLMRTTYYPKWKRVFSESKGEYVFYPKEIRVYDEVEKDNQSIIVLRKVDLRTLSPNIFTKAWLESKSR